MTATLQAVDRKTLAHDFGNLLKGRADDAFITSHVKQIMAPAALTAYPANGSVASLVFGLQISCQITNGKQFQDWIWGAALPGGGALFGDVYTNDIKKLYAATTQVIATFTPVYTAFYWLDASNTNLGYFQAGSISTVAGSAAGPASPSDWS